MTLTEIERPTVDVAEPMTPTTPPRPARSRPSWVRRPTRSGWIVIGLAAFTGILYFWGLGRDGVANDYYTAAVKSASVSWKAFFFGSLDPGSFITVDKPPAALWVMGLSTRLFGFSTWSMLMPQALAGVGSVLILHHLVRKWAGDVAAHLAAFAFAVTPVAVAMFRYNNPDALLTLLCLGAAWALWSAVEHGRTRSLVLCGLLLGLAFETKMLQAFLVLPALGLVYLVAGPPELGKRLLQLLAGGAAMLVAGGWWVAIVALWPASSRPYIGSTTDNSILSLVFGYNGLSRIFGGEGPSAAAGGPGGGPGFGGTPGVFRLFNVTNGAQISWLIPLALAGLGAGLWLTRREPRTGQGRAGWLLWGGWALTCMAVFSLSSGIFHEYYSVQLAPALAALAGAGGVALWRLGATNRVLRLALPAAIVASAAWAVVLLNRTPNDHAWLRPAIVIGAALAAGGIWLGIQLRNKVVVIVAAAIAAVTLLAGPTAHAIKTVGDGVFPGGVLDTATADIELIDYLEANRGDATYLVAAFGSRRTESIIIETGDPVITIGGFNGGDPAPTLEELQQLVADGEVRYVLVDGGGFFAGPRHRGSGSTITSWVTDNGIEVPASTYGGSGQSGTLYDLSTLDTEGTS